MLTHGPGGPSLLRADLVALLLAPERWHVISSSFKPDTPPTRATRHAQWSRRHGHVHPYMEILFVVRGGTHYGLNGEMYGLQPGTVFIFRPGDRHDMGYRRERGVAEHIWVSVLRDHYAARLIRRDGKGDFREAWRFVLTQGEVGVAPTCFGNEEADKPLPPVVRRARVVAALTLLWCALIRKDADPKQRRGETPFQETIVRAVQRHIQETGGRGATLESIARIAGYSKYHFLRVFKKHAGMTLQGFVDSCRVERVRELTEQGMTRKAISVELGFSHPSAFARWSRRHLRV